MDTLTTLALSRVYSQYFKEGGASFLDMELVAAANDHVAFDSELEDVWLPFTLSPLRDFRDSVLRPIDWAFLDAREWIP